MRSAGFRRDEYRRSRLGHAARLRLSAILEVVRRGRGGSGHGMKAGGTLVNPGMTRSRETPRLSQGCSPRALVEEGCLQREAQEQTLNSISDWADIVPRV